MGYIGFISTFEKYNMSVFDQIKSRKRICSFANATQQTQSMDAPTSGYGGVFWGRSDEKWPTSNGEALLPVLSVRVDELPYYPVHLEGIALINLFVHEEMMLGGATDEEVIRVYKTLDGLQPLKALKSEQVPFFQIDWELREDYPGPGDIASIWVDEFAAYDEFDALKDEAKAKIPHHYGTKVGGWPNHLQDNIISDDDEPFVLQLDETSIYSFLDGGMGYLVIQDGDFWILWESS